MMTGALFYILALLIACSAIGVAVSRNIVRMAVCLFFTLMGIAGLYFLLNAEFLAAVQLIVYAGGTLILIVFGVMLTNRSVIGGYEPRRGEVAIAILIGAVLLGTLVTAIVALPGADAPPASGAYPVMELGAALLGDYLLPFELVSVVLLVVMIGAAYLAKRRREGDLP